MAVTGRSCRQAMRAPSPRPSRPSSPTPVCGTNSVQRRARTFRRTPPGHGPKGWAAHWRPPGRGGEIDIASLRQRPSRAVRSPSLAGNPLMNRVIKTLIALAAVCALAAPVAHANYKSVIKDCAQDGKLDKKYSDADLIKAKKKLPSDLNEYSDCSDVIAAAIGGAGKHGGGGGSGGGGGGGAPATGPAPARAAAQQDSNDL